MLERLALKIAAGILPFAMETITTEEETVEGKAARKKMPSHKGKMESWNKGLMRSTSKGNNTKVVNCITTCIFQLLRPAFIFSGLNRSP